MPFLVIDVSIRLAGLAVFTKEHRRDQFIQLYSTRSRYVTDRQVRVLAKLSHFNGAYTRTDSFVTIRQR